MASSAGETLQENFASEIGTPIKEEERTAKFDVVSSADDTVDNPYKLPDETDVAKILLEEKKKQRLERKLFLSKPLHMKTTKAYREGTMQSDILKVIPPVPLPKEPPKSPTNNIRNDPEFLKALATGEKLRNMENISSFVKTKREMFLLQYLIGVKRDEMLKMEMHEKDEEKRLDIAEKYLEEDALKFDQFLKRNDHEAVEASKQAEVETKLKLDKIADIKKIHVQISSIKSEINKLEEILIEYNKYKKFLFQLAPIEWQNMHTKSIEIKKLSKGSGKIQAITPIEKKVSAIRGREVTRLLSRTRRSSVAISSGFTGKESVMSTIRKRRTFERKEADAHLTSNLEGSSSSINLQHEEPSFDSSIISLLANEDEDDDDTLPLYFSYPKQLLDIFVNLEEMNLTLIQKSQETEETLEEVQDKYLTIKQTLGKEVGILKAQIDQLEKLVERERKKANEFEVMSKIYSFGEFNEMAQEKMLQELNLAIQDVYEGILGPNNVNLSTLQMMVSIENKLEELLEVIDTLPAGKVEAAGKLQDRQRRIQQRQQKLKEQHDQQLERMRKMASKAMAVTTKIPGRKLVFRSAPPQPKISAEKSQWLGKEDEEMIYFFT